MDCDKYKDQVVCRGSVALGSGCGYCARCLEEKAKMVAKTGQDILKQIVKTHNEFLEVVSVPHVMEVKSKFPFNTSKRALDWRQFSDAVENHIETYTVPQYGDKGDDLASEYSAEDCLQQVKKYIARFGSNSREGQEQLDLFKMAHYIQMAWESVNNGKENNS